MRSSGPNILAVNYRVQLVGGLHARPAVRLTQVASQFASLLTISAPGKATADAKSIIEVMRLKIEENGTVEIRAEGSDCVEAVYALIRCFETVDEG